MNFINNAFGLGGGNSGGNRQPGHNQYGGGYQQMPQQKAQYQDFLNVMPAYAYDKGEQLEKSAKILLPGDVLQTISNFTFPVPMLFCITNTYTNKRFYAGVLEFTATQGHCVLPFWMYQQIGCFEGQQVGVSLVTDYKKGKLVRIQPHETAFIDLPNPKAILEHELPLQVQFLSKDQTIEINHMGKMYKINILKVEPDDETHTICIVDTDLNIDFAPPLDYVEEVPSLPQLTKKTSSQKAREEAEEGQFSAFQGNCVRIDEKPVDQKKIRREIEEKKQKQNDYDPRKFKLKNGIRQNIESNNFSGSAVSIGATRMSKK